LLGADDLFLDLRDNLAWESSRRWMYEREVAVPRLTANLSEDESDTYPVITQVRQLLARDYEADLKGAFAALYRDGNDSVAWHSDRVDLSRSTHTSAIVSLGGPRKFLLRPKGGGRSLPIWLESGDLLVLGGAIQHGWEHCVPKVTHALPRIALLYFGGDREPPRGIRQPATR
jgi:alkylated DNA repair dioxygenase AlkB